MSVLWIEGFDSFGTTDGAAPVGLAAKYESSNVLNSTVRAGRFAGNSLRLRGGGGQAAYVTTPNLGNVLTIAVGFAFKRAGALNDFRIVSLREADDATEGVNLRCRSDGKLDFYLGASLIATTAVAQLAVDSWRHIELKVTVGNSGSGSYELRVNGATVLSGSADTQAGANAYANRVRLLGADESSANGNQFDDFWVATDFLGDKKVVTTFPVADGDSSDFTPSTPGDNFAMVDENPSDGDSTYVESSTPGATDLYTHGSVGAGSTIAAVQICVTAKKTDVTNFDMHLVVKSGATESDGSAVTVAATDYASYSRVLENDPATGLPWTPASLNSAQIGPKVG